MNGPELLWGEFGVNEGPGSSPGGSFGVNEGPGTSPGVVWCK